MTKRPTEIVQETLSVTSQIEKEMEAFIRDRDEFNRQLRNLRAKIKRKKNSFYPDKLSAELIKQIKQDAPSVLINQIELAVLSSQEFDHPAYKEALFSVAKDESIYRIVKRGSGWGTSLNVKIEFGNSAGTLADYGRGVTAYRDFLKTKIGDVDSNRGLNATNWWLTKVYGNSLQTKTILGRIAASGRKAPFWQILNSGGTTLSSDRGDGSFNPINQPPTSFIKDAETRLESQFLLAFLAEDQQWKREIRELEQFEYETTEIRNSVSNRVNELRYEKSANQAIFNSFGELRKFISGDKFEKALARYRAGEEFERVLISRTGTRKVYLTKQRIEGLV